MSPTFAPVRADGRSYWRVIFEFIDGRLADGTLVEGDIIRHQDLLEETELPARTAVYYAAIDKAAWELKAQRSRSLKSIRGTGYQVINGEAMVDEARGRQTRGRRVLSGALATARAIDRAELPPEIKIDQIITGLVAIFNYSKLTAEKVEEHEREISALKQARMVDRAASRATDEEMASLKEQLAEQAKRLDDLEGR